jgi:hypothetical protein
LILDYSMKPSVTKFYTCCTTISSNAPSSSDESSPAASSSLDESTSPCESFIPVDLSFSTEPLFLAASIPEPSLRRIHRLRHPTNRYSPSVFGLLLFLSRHLIVMPFFINNGSM